MDSAGQVFRDECLEYFLCFGNKKKAWYVFLCNINLCT